MLLNVLHNIRYITRIQAVGLLPYVLGVSNLQNSWTNGNKCLHFLVPSMYSNVFTPMFYTTVCTLFYWINSNQIKHTVLPPSELTPIMPFAVCVCFARRVQSCQVEVVEFLESFPWSPEADAIQLEHFSVIMPFAYVVQWGGGGVVGGFFSVISSCEIIFLPNIKWYSWVQTHILLKYDTNSHFLREENFAIKFPQFREFSLQFRETWRSRPISGDSRKFRETWQVCVCISTLVTTLLVTAPVGLRSPTPFDRSWQDMAKGLSPTISMGWVLYVMWQYEYLPVKTLIPKTAMSVILIGTYK